MASKQLISVGLEPVLDLTELKSCIASYYKQFSKNRNIDISFVGRVLRYDKTVLNRINFSFTICEKLPIKLKTLNVLTFICFVSGQFRSFS